MDRLQLFHRIARGEKPEDVREPSETGRTNKTKPNTVGCPTEPQSSVAIEEKCGLPISNLDLPRWSKADQIIGLLLTKWNMKSNSPEKANSISEFTNKSFERKQVVAAN